MVVHTKKLVLAEVEAAATYRNCPARDLTLRHEDGGITIESDTEKGLLFLEFLILRCWATRLW